MKRFWALHKQDVFAALAILCSCFLFLFLLLRLYQADLNYPLYYDGSDCLTMFTKAKLLQEGGWTFENVRVGAPFTADFYDFMAYGMTYVDDLVLKFLVTVIPNFVMALNLQFLLLFPTIALIAYFVMRSLKIRCLVAAPCAVAFAFLPAIFYRNILHFNLSTYQFVPLSILLCIWLYTDDQFMRLKGFWHYRRNLYAIVFALFIANNGIAYYAFFTCFFLAVTGVMRALRDKKWMPLVRSLCTVGFVCFFVVLALSPIFVYHIKNGPNPLVATRAAAEAEVYATRLSLLLLPSTAHRVPLLSTWVQTSKSLPLLNENTASHLGLLAVAGFVFLFLFFFVKKKDTLRYRQMELLSGLNLFGFLLGTMGGLGSLFAIIVSSSLRCFNRISVFLSFICILAVALLLNRYTQKIKPWLLSGLMAVMCVVTVLEQFPSIVSDYGAIKESFQSEQEFVQSIEDQVPEGSMIYQLPYHSYPESGPVHNMADYQLYTGYLHSDSLRWSYGGMRGRKADLWNSAVNSLELSEQVKVLSLEGFEGIYIDNRAYTQEDLSSLLKELESLLEVAPITSRDGNLTFFSMATYNESYRSLYTEEELDDLKRQIEGFTQILYGEGISAQENDGKEDYRWCSKIGVLTVINNQDTPVQASLRFRVLAADGKTSRFTVTVNGNTQEFQISPEGTVIDLAFEALPGANEIQLETEGNAYVTPSDPRSLYFQLRGVSCSLTDYRLELKKYNG